MIENYELEDEVPKESETIEKILASIQKNREMIDFLKKVIRNSYKQFVNEQDDLVFEFGLQIIGSESEVFLSIENNGENSGDISMSLDAAKCLRDYLNKMLPKEG